MNSIWIPLAVALAAAAGTGVRAEAAPAPASQAMDATHQARWQQAQQAFREHRYAAAYGRFAALADAGHVPSAHMALAMLRQGPGLFGTAWTATLPQQRRWSVLAVEDLRQQWLVDPGNGTE